MSRAAWGIGRAIEEIETPALLLDIERLRRNLDRMAAWFGGRTARLRPHFKNHKSTTLARLQLAAGSAVGVTCAKLGEAEACVEAGLEDVLIANQIVGRRKVERLAALACRARIAVAIDDADQARAISVAAAAAGATVDVLVEVDVGMGRCGVAPGEPALALARRVEELPAVRFRGIQAFEGHIVYLADREERTRRARDSMGLAVETRRLIERAGIPVGVVSGGSSATYDASGAVDGVDEIQAGTYATMDWRYAELVPEFEVALSVLARVISRRPGVAVLDLGVKAAGGEFGPPRVAGAPGVSVPYFLSEEHLVLHHVPGWNVGDVVHVIPSHACTTCNLHREIVVHADGRVVDVWPIEASGVPQ